MAATNKCLAQSNKSCNEAWATKKYLLRSPTCGLETGQRDPASFTVLQPKKGEWKCLE
jgi:hypothetical protein